MNERIKELLEEAGVKYVTMPKDTVYEKFAELIVRECAKEIEFQYGGGNLMEDGVTHNPEWDNAVECVSAMIKQHFGVEE